MFCRVALPVQLSSSLWSEQSRKPSHLSLSNTHASPSAHIVPFAHCRGLRVAEERQVPATGSYPRHTWENGIGAKEGFGDHHSVGFKWDAHI